MAVFPKIQGPCPYQNRLAEIMQGDVCKMCRRQVFDLTNMDDQQRLAFLRSCESEVCVSYLAPARIAVAALAAAAAAAAPIAAAAQQAAAPPPAGVMMLAGTIRDPAHTQFVHDAGDAAIPALPVVYETKSKTPAATPVSADSSGTAKPIKSKARS
jgi:hypothetical protein